MPTITFAVHAVLDMESVLIAVIGLLFLTDGVRGDTCLPPAAAENCRKNLHQGQYPFMRRGGEGRERGGRGEGEGRERGGRGEGGRGEGEGEGRERERGKGREERRREERGRGKEGRL